MKRPREFQTADGFILMYDADKNVWTDGELVFDAKSPDFWPIDSNKEPVAGKFIPPSSGFFGPWSPWDSRES
jgi:hypothetical protein